MRLFFSPMRLSENLLIGMFTVGHRRNYDLSYDFPASQVCRQTYVNLGSFEWILQSYYAILQFLWLQAGSNSGPKRSQYRIILTLGNTQRADTNRKNAGDISRQSISQNQLLRRLISWTYRALKLVRMSSKSDTQLQQVAVGDNSNLHKKPA